MFLRLVRCSSTVASNAGPTATTIKHFDSIPGPKAYPILGSVPNYLPVIGKYNPKDMISSGTLKFNEYGPVVREKIARENTYSLYLFDPADIETLFRNVGTYRSSHFVMGHIRKQSDDHANGGILMENGPTWTHLRTTTQQSFTMDASEQYMPAFDRIATRFISKLKNDPVMEKVVKTNFLSALMAHSCDITTHILFGFDLDCVNDILDDNAITTRVINSSAYINRMVAPLDYGPRLWKYFPTPAYKKMLICEADVSYFPKREVKARLQDKSLCNGPGILNDWIRKGRTDASMMNTILSDLVLAGIDTTSYTMSFILYNLSTNKHVQTKLLEELRTLDPDIKNSISISNKMLSQATYLKRVVKESMRLFPISVGTSRTLDEPLVIGGYQIPAKTKVVTMNQVTCRLDKYVERANEFIPERYDTNSGFKKIRPFTMLPFGHGPRGCLGRRMAELSMYTFLFKLLRHYEIDWVGDKPLGCIAQSITEPDGPLFFKFTPRDS